MHTIYLTYFWSNVWHIAVSLPSSPLKLQALWGQGLCLMQPSFSPSQGSITGDWMLAGMESILVDLGAVCFKINGISIIFSQGDTFSHPSKSSIRWVKKKIASECEVEINPCLINNWKENLLVESGECLQLRTEMCHKVGTYSPVWLATLDFSTSQRPSGLPGWGFYEEDPGRA